MKTKKRTCHDEDVVHVGAHKVVWAGLWRDDEHLWLASLRVEAADGELVAWRGGAGGVAEDAGEDAAGEVAGALWVEVGAANERGHDKQAPDVDAKALREDWAHAGAPDEGLLFVC